MFHIEIENYYHLLEDVILTVNIKSTFLVLYINTLKLYNIFRIFMIMNRIH